MLNIQIYNKTKCSSGYFDENGVIHHDLDTYWNVTGFMQVTPGSKCSYEGLTFVTANQYACFYDVDQQFVSSFLPSLTDQQITIPSNVYFVRFSLCRHTRINFFSQELEVGSISEDSGSNEAGDSFRRTIEYIPIANNGTADLVPNYTYTLSVNNPVKQMALYYYRPSNDGSGIIFDSISKTTFDEEISVLTFTIPNVSKLSELRVRFYDPDNVDIQPMLNAGSIAMDYLPYSDTNSDDTSTFRFYIYAEAYEGFRDELYQWIKSTLSPNLTEKDLDIIIRLMCYIFGDLSGLVYNLKSQIDPDKADEIYLRHLGSNIGYEWNKALTADQQRESMKLYIDLQKKRGTLFSLQNLIAVFGQDKASYYSTSDLRGVNIIEGGKDGEPVGTADVNGLFPGDIMIEIPQFSNILKEAIDNIRLIGTRIFFTYIIYCGPFDLSLGVDAGHELNMFFDPAYWGYDPTIEEFTSIVEDEYGEDYTIDDIKDWPIVNTRVTNCKANTCCVVYTAYAEPFEKGFVWHEAGNTNYQGFMMDDETLKEDDSMYGYGHE